MSDAALTRPSRLAVLMFTDVVDSTLLKSRLGTTTYVRLLGLHDQLFRRLIGATPGAQLLQDAGDGYFAAFETVSDAVTFALRFQHEMGAQQWDPEPLRSRVGIHVGEVAQMRQSEDDGGSAKLIGMAADVAARVMSLAMGGQILLTRSAFDEARQFVSEFRADGETPVPLKWMAHGEYLLKGNPDPLEVFEVGIERISPLTAPPDTEKARRSVSAEQEETLGWRPAVGLMVPERPAWLLEKK